MLCWCSIREKAATIVTKYLTFTELLRILFSHWLVKLFRADHTFLTEYTEGRGKDGREACDDFSVGCCTLVSLPFFTKSLSRALTWSTKEVLMVAIRGQKL